MQARVNGRGSGAFGQFFSEGLVRKTLEKSSKMFYLFQSKPTHPPQTHTHTHTHTHFNGPGYHLVAYQR